MKFFQIEKLSTGAVADVIPIFKAKQNDKLSACKRHFLQILITYQFQNGTKAVFSPFYEWS